MFAETRTNVIITDSHKAYLVVGIIRQPADINIIRQMGKVGNLIADGQDVSYDVTLFGGLGGFLYALAYDADGNKRTLADLDYLGTEDPEAELDFTINSSAVTEAWETSMNTGSIDSKWKVVNFALCYNGIPQSKFSADKGIAPPASVGLPTESSGHKPLGGYTLINLAEAVDDIAAKDLRSYLQRPVYSLRAFFDALSNPDNVGGYTFDASVLDDSTKFPYQKLWMTLPMLPSLTIKPETRTPSMTLVSSMTFDNVIGRYNIQGGVPAGSIVEASVHFSMNLLLPSEGASAASTMYAVKYEEISGVDTYNGTAFFLQALAYGADGTLVTGSKIQTICEIPLVQPDWLADQLGYVPVLAGTGWDPLIWNVPFLRMGSGSHTFQCTHGFEFEFEGRNIAYFTVRVDMYKYTAARSEGVPTILAHSTGGQISDGVLYDQDDNEFSVSNADITTDGGDTCTVTTSDNLRSGAPITKRLLLSTEKTPADYLTSFCKTFGLVLRYDDGAKKVTLMRRRDFFQDTTLDLTGRVVRTKDLSIDPVAFSAKWYRFAAEDIGGAFAKGYADIYGRTYGEQRVNTGYDFNAEVRDLLHGYAYKGAAAILGKSRFNCIVFQGGVFRPSPFLMTGNKYTLWTDDANRTAQSYDVPVPNATATITYFNQYPGYDYRGTYRAELRDADNKPAGDGAGVLLMHIGAVTLPYFKLTDDIAAMDVINDGVPCWFLNPGPSTGVTAQLFSRYKETVAGEISLSLDFGVPAEVGIPDITYPETTTIYRKAWRAFIADKYDQDTKVLRCYVDMRGIRVDAELLRGFYYYAGSLWSLNKIENYSPTTPDPVLCEFVQVQDKNAYIAGQF